VITGGSRAIERAIERGRIIASKEPHAHTRTALHEKSKKEKGCSNDDDHAYKGRNEVISTRISTTTTTTHGWVARPKERHAWRG